MVTNPLVRQALHEVRKVVNAILRELVYKDGHRLARIHIELAREVRGTFEQRQKLIREMRDRERRREEAAEAIRAAGVKPTRAAIDRYLLWQEQDKQCIYSGRPIGIAQLFGGEVDVDHILPYPRSLDNSLMNRVVCFREENADKSDRTPYEWLAERDPARYEAVLQRADRLPHYQKARRFRQRSVELDDFFARQFVDTTYITTQVHQYVQCLGADVLCPKGQHTADLRWQWGLDSVLRDDGLGLKNREDHRHHAVDAVVIALTNRSRLQQLAALRRRGGTERTGEILNEPWAGFRRSVEDAVNGINVSHRVRRKVAGALHEETIYGPTNTPGEFVYRKPIEALTPSMVEDIRDPIVRSLVQQRLAAFKIAGDASKIPAEVWKEPLYMYAPKSKQLLPIRRVRLIRQEGTIRPIRGGTAYVKPGSIHHVCLFEWTEPNGKVTRDMVSVSMLEAVERVKNKKPIIEKTHPTRTDARFVMSLSGGELVLLTHRDQEALYRFDTAASTSKQMWFRHHTAAGKSSDKRGVVSKKPGTLRARKVTVDPIGRIRWAND
jgi:CRISPR-associated endonuclease Csn1